MSDEETIEEPEERPRGLSRFQRVALAGLSLLLVVSIGARWALAGDAPAEGEGVALTESGNSGAGSASPGALGLRDSSSQGGGAGPSTGEPAPAEADSFESLLPYFTEGSFFALIGFAVGYASRKFVKVGLIALGVFFVGLQALSYADVVAVDWERAVDLANRLVLNLKENQTFSEVLKDKVPTVGALTAGYFLGFRRG